MKNVPRNGYRCKMFVIDAVKSKYLLVFCLWHSQMDKDGPRIAYGVHSMG